MPFSPRGKVLSTGAIEDHLPFATNDFRNIVRRFVEENRQANTVWVSLLGPVADSEGSDPRANRHRLAIGAPWLVTPPTRPNCIA